MQLHLQPGLAVPWCGVSSTVRKKLQGILERIIRAAVLQFWKK